MTISVDLSLSVSGTDQFGVVELRGSVISPDIAIECDDTAVLVSRKSSYVNTRRLRKISKAGICFLYITDEETSAQCGFHLSPMLISTIPTPCPWYAAIYLRASGNEYERIVSTVKTNKRCVMRIYLYSNALKKIDRNDSNKCVVYDIRSKYVAKNTIHKGAYIPNYKWKLLPLS
jgi:hypothetical protein